MVTASTSLATLVTAAAPASASPSSALLAWYQQHGEFERYEMLATIDLIVTN